MNGQKRPTHSMVLFTKQHVENQQADHHQWVDAEKPLHAVTNQGALLRLSGGVANNKATNNEEQVNTKGAILKQRVAQIRLGIHVVQIISKVKKDDQQGRQPPQILD